MKQKDIKYNAINKLDTDFKAEIVAASFIESGVDADKILIMRQKGDKRHISKDVAEVKNDFSKQDLMEYLYIYTNRSSIYDTIPENIFHQPFETAKKKSQEDIIKDIRRHREEEFYARRYFQPFEMAVDQLLIDAELYERKFDKRNFHSNLRDILSGYWSILKCMNLKQSIFFIKIIPILHLITTDFALAGKLMGVILDVSLNINLSKLSEFKTNVSLKVNNNTWQLGVNSALGDTFKDGYRDIDIIIGPTYPEKIKLFSEGFTDRLILDELIAMMLPANIQKKIKFETVTEHSRFCLSDKNHKTYLGVNTRI